MKRIWIVVASVAIVATACASSTAEPVATTVSIDPETVVVRIEQSGGCFMMGPNCPTYVLYANGRVDLFRTEELDTPVDSTEVDVALVAALVRHIDATDLTELRQRLPQGACQGCFDGIDTVFRFITRAGESVFNSIEEELSPLEPLFAAVWDIVDAASQSTEMPLEQRY